MGRTKSELEGIKLLGSGSTEYRDTYDPSILECFVNKHPDLDYMVKLVCSEFTSLCPLTGQPDFGSIIIRYIPLEKMVESKSLKLYLFSFRNNGDFHEDCVNIILKDLRDLMSPKYIEVEGKFNPRGGIKIYPFSAWGIPNSKYQAMAENRIIKINP